MASALEIRGLTRKFPGFTLGPIDLTVPTGAIYGFVGPNGAGKTTTIDILMGMCDKSAGSVTVHGLDHIRDEVAMKRLIGYVSPEINYWAWGKVERAIRFVKGFYPSWDDAYAARLMETLDLKPSQRISQLSFGSRIKLSLLLALSWRPPVLVLDEPTVGLDAIVKQQVFAELLAAVREGERTVFISSHGIADLERFADHVGMIKQGKMIFEGPIADILERYRIVDVAGGIADEIADRAGVHVQERQPGRLRVLIDTALAPLDWLRNRDGAHVTEVPVSLEELFVALGRR